LVVGWGKREAKLDYGSRDLRVGVGGYFLSEEGRRWI